MKNRRGWIYAPRLEVSVDIATLPAKAEPPTPTATRAPTPRPTPTPAAQPPPTGGNCDSDPLGCYDDNNNGRITCVEASAHGIAPVRRDHPAYPYINDRDNDGIVCERD